LVGVEISTSDGLTLPFGTIAEIIYTFLTWWVFRITELRGLGILTLLVLTGNGVWPWLTATFILKLGEMWITPPRVFSTLMLYKALTCHVDFPNSTSFHITYPEYVVHLWCTSTSDFDVVGYMKYGGIRAGNLP
jgi:hypothetical protein